MERGTAETHKKILKKMGETRSLPVVATKDGISTTYRNIYVAAEETKVPKTTLQRLINGTTQTTKHDYTFSYLEVVDLPGEIWKPLPKLQDIPEFVFDKRKRAYERPAKMWARTQVSSCGRVKIGGKRVTSGFDFDVYLAAKIDGIYFKMHVLVVLAFKIDEYHEGFQIHHIDENKHNNRLENLKPCSIGDHVKQTRIDNPDQNKKISHAMSQLLKLTESTTHSALVGQEKLCAEWSQLLGISRAAINNATRTNAYANRKHKFSKVESLLLEGETEIEHSIYTADGTFTSYKVTTFGRFWSDKAHRWTSVSGQIACGGRFWYIHQLVLMAKTKVTSIPEDMTVDHIHGRDHEWPHRMENLRWADYKLQNQNRAVRE
jgi:hypothetical protein